jgi:cell division protein FtsB
MAKQPEELVVRILRDIQRTLADHTKQFEAVDRRFDAIEQRLDDMNDGLVAALGLTTRVEIRQNALAKRVAELEALVGGLGGKR